MTPSFGLPAELAELADEYELLEELGRGGSAIVYRARDRALGRDVAIKVVHPRAASPDDDPVARLAREARTVAQLQHSGIVAVYAVRRLHAGGLALVMQFVPGATLKQSIQRCGPFGAARTEEILRDVAHALAYAHARRLVHRDVKPENIFLDAESGRALLADFGIARSTEADSLTMTGTAIGTPFYMSPEQIDGMAVDGRSDLYSLGLVAWEMLTGLRPWDGESLYHVIYKQKHDELPPIEAMRRDVPRRLQYIVERMLQKQPAARWAGADGLLAQLDRTILPADYAQWQAALPGRVTRHRAVPGIQRPSDGAAPIGAATVQFTSGRALARHAEPQTAAHGRVADAPSFVPVPVPPVVAERPTEPTSTPVMNLAGPTPPAPSGDDTACALPTYDMAAPSWASLDVDAQRTSTRTWVWRAFGGATLTAALATLTAVVLGSQILPTRLVPPSGPANASQSGAVSISRPAPAGSRWVARDVRSESPASAERRSSESTGLDLIAVGAHHGCSITLADSVQCWGSNDGAQLGVGTTVVDGPRPRPVAGVMTYTALAAGASHTCGVTYPGDVYCWGANDRGQLGDGTTIVRSAPVRVAGVGTYRMVRGGAAHTCALDVEGPVRCWGDNSIGQLGDGTRISQSLPTLVRLPKGAVAVALATGAYHSCALLRDRRVVCWGANSNGQLGVAGEPVSLEPREVPGVRASAIGAGAAHTCAVLQGGAVRCWGLDASGQLGTGERTDGAPGRLTVIAGREDIRSVVAGAAHSCALTRGGSLWCWGGTRGGARPHLLRFGRNPYIAVAAAGNATCAIALGRVAECWTGMATEGRPSQIVAPSLPARVHGRIHRRGARRT